MPPPAKLICSIFSRHGEYIEKALDRMTRLYGPVSERSPLLPFEWTTYYEREFGADLKRIFVGFEPLIDQASLVDVKYKVREVEEEFSRDGRRTVNIDPGLLTPERLILATFKNFTHRIYLSKGVYADLTLIFQKGSFRPLEWTYPDYASQQAIDFWNQVRKGYMDKLKEMVK